MLPNLSLKFKIGYNDSSNLQSINTQSFEMFETNISYAYKTNVTTDESVKSVNFTS